MKKSTITDLPNDIRALIPESERSEAINKIITEAEAGEYHDFKNKKYVCGKMAVNELLHKTGDKRLEVIRQAVINGEYDESPDDEDKATMKKDWIEGGGTEASYKAFFGAD